MWTINPREVIALRGGGGEPFTMFMDDIIRAEGFAKGIDPAAIRTTVRTNIADGGVDTEVSSAPAARRGGWLNQPTLWQYKATDYSDVSTPALRSEVTKEYASTLIMRGYAYRLCICDDMPAATKQSWEDVLTEEVLRINLAAPLPKVLSASDIANWASQYTALVIKHFDRPNHGVLHLTAWGDSIKSSTLSYVQIPDWVPIGEQIYQHVDLMKEAIDAVLPLQGEAGVGKTRLTFETLAAIPNAAQLVVYTNDGKVAEAVATALANHNGTHAILVADECNLNSRVRINDMLRGHRARVRVVALDNSGERPRSGAPEVWLRRIPNTSVEEILRLNFPEVPDDRRRAYVGLSSGFVRLAADLCRYDQRIGTLGLFVGTPATIQDYYRQRLPEEDQKVVEAISLLSKVGFDADVGDELVELCTLLRMDAARVIETATRLKDVPGFIAKAGRYFYVTPEIISMIAFGRAWDRWIAEGSADFLSKMDERLVDPFMQRITRSGNEEAGHVVGTYFQHWASNLGPAELAQRSVVERAASLAEAQPELYLPLLSALVNRASHAELLSTGEYRNQDRPTRRKLVWLAEELAVFPDLFSLAEGMLFRFAQVEVEPGIGNNASGVWRELFRIVGSGTSVPFPDRLMLLERRMFGATPDQMPLVVGALHEAFAAPSWHRVGSAVIGGRIPPEEWKPQTSTDYQACLAAVIALVERMLAADEKALVDAGYEVLLKHLTRLTDNGHLDRLKLIFTPGKLPDDILPTLLEAVENASRHAMLNSKRHARYQELAQDLVEWTQELIPDNFHGRVVALVGRSHWHFQFQEKRGEWQEALRKLAAELHANPKLLASEIDWLSSSEAASGTYLGQALGAEDFDAIHLSLILDKAVQRNYAAFARGYVGGLAEMHVDQAATLNGGLDMVTDIDPVIGYELFLAGADRTQALQRTLALVDAGRLPPEYLGAFQYGVARRALNPSELQQILEKLLVSARRGDAKAARAAIGIAAARLDEQDGRSERSVLAQSEVQPYIWDLLEVTLRIDGGENHWWGELLKVAASWNAQRGIAVASEAVIHGGFERREAAVELLAELAQREPELVLERIGRLVFDESSRWHFFVGSFRSLFMSLPEDALKAWIRGVGVEGARAVARHLPRPFLDNVGCPVVPSLTAFVLEEFEDDDRTYREFATGVHSNELLSGDIAEILAARADDARHFLNHELRRVRQWAAEDVAYCTQQERWWRQHNEEMNLP